MKKLFLVLFLFPVLVLAQAVAPAGTVPNSSGLSGLIAWFEANWGVIATILLGVSESLALIFPASSGFGGILASIIGFLKNIGTKPPAVS